MGDEQRTSLSSSHIHGSLVAAWPAKGDSLGPRSLGPVDPGGPRTHSEGDSLGPGGLGPTVRVTACWPRGLRTHSEGDSLLAQGA